MFPICDRNYFEKISLLRKLQILHWVFPPKPIDLFALTDGIFETGAYGVPSESQNPTVLVQGGLSST